MMNPQNGPNIPQGQRQLLVDIKDPLFWELQAKCSPFSLLSVEKFYNLFSAVQYVSANKIEGDLIECGVYNGGAVLMIADILHERNDLQRDLFLYDTFFGFVERSDIDKTENGKEVGKVRRQNFMKQAQDTMALSLYPQDRIHFVPGDVRETVVADTHERIALLRLDTDTYATTLHELTILYDLVVPGGVVIIDDYGYSLGCRQAVDEFFINRPMPLFQRPNSGCRTAVKLRL